MSHPTKQVVLITGASSGIGRACAEHLHAKGHRVYGTARKPFTAAFETLVMDVDDESVEAGVRAILARESRIDAVVNNAGFAILGAVEDTSIAEAKRQFETNFFGVLRVCRAVLPAMRAQKSGRIVNVSSLGGVFGMPFSGMYSATKFAVEGMSEALRLEAKAFGVRVTLIEPGDFNTNFVLARRETTATLPSSPYHATYKRVMAAAEKDEKNSPTPEPIARLLEHVLTTRSPKLRYTVGMVSQRIVVVLKRWLTAALFEWILTKATAIE